MKIYGNLVDSIRPAGAGSVTPPPARDDAPAQPVAPVAPISNRSDSVEISQHGRSLAGMEETDPERVAELRRKVYEGAYNSLDIVDQVARRIVRSGDL